MTDFGQGKARHARGRKALMVQKCEVALTSMVACMLSSGASSSFLPVTMPALFTRMLTSPTCGEKSEWGKKKEDKTRQGSSSRLNEIGDQQLQNRGDCMHFLGLPSGETQQSG